MAIRQKLDGVPCVQFELAVGNKQRRCVYCGHVVKKPRGKTHECKGRIQKLMIRYVNLCFNPSVEGLNGNIAGREVEEVVEETKRGS